MAKTIEPRNEHLEVWKFQLSSGQRDALRLAYQGQNIRRGVSNIYGELHWKSYDKITRMKLLSGGRITDLGRAVFESAQPAAEADAPAPVEAALNSGYSVMTAAELLDVARQAWRDYDLKEVVGEYANMGASVMMDLAMNATPADTDALETLRAQLAQAQAENARLVAEVDALRAFVDYVMTFDESDYLAEELSAFNVVERKAIELVDALKRAAATHESEGSDG